MKTGSFTHAAIDESGRACATDSSGAIACWSIVDGTAAAFGDLPSGPFTQIVAGLSTFCALRTTGTTVCWGDTPVAPPDGW